MTSHPRPEAETTQIITADGKTYTFNIGAKWLMSDSGYGMPDIKYITQQGPIQHGETMLGYRFQPRTIQIVHRVNGCSRQEFWDNRTTLLSFLSPSRQAIGSFAPLKLRKTFEYGNQYDIDVFCLQGPVFEAHDISKWDEWSFTETLRFIAPDPTFYNPFLNYQTITYGAFDSLVFGFNGGLSFTSPLSPHTTGLNFTYGLIDTTGGCTTQGNWPVFPTITITGPCNGVSITNNNTNEKIEINYNLPSGQTIIVDLTYGNKRVYVQETGQNLIGTLSTDSSLATFHLEPDPGVAGGINILRFYAGSINVATTTITVSWHDRFIGI